VCDEWYRLQIVEDLKGKKDADGIDPPSMSNQGHRWMGVVVGKDLRKKEYKE